MELTLDQALQKGINAFNSGKIQDAQDLFKLILQSKPNHPEANNYLGYLNLKNGNLKDSLYFFKTAVEASPSTGKFWSSYIEALLHQGNVEGAKAVFDQTVVNGIEFEKKGEFLKTIKLLSNQSNPPVIEKNNLSKKQIEEPSKQQLQALLIKYQNGELETVIKHSEALLKIYPKALHVWNILGVTTARIGKLDKAVRAFRKVIRIDPNFAEAHFNLGNALKDQGEIDNALEAFNKAISIKPDYAEAYYNIGVGLRENRRIDDAIRSFEKAIMIKPNYIEAYNNIGALLKGQGKLDDAIKIYKKAIVIKPDYAEAYNNLGNAFKSQGETEKALEAYDKALTISPDYDDIISNVLELLKVFSPKTSKTNLIFDVDKKIKKIGSRISADNSEIEIAHSLSKAFDYIDNANLNIKTPLSQIYKHNSVDLNCKRHFAIFKTENIIPKFCFGCFKVQVNVVNFHSLIKLTALFYELNLGHDVTTKTLVELRPDIPGFYKGLIYCRGLEQAKQVKKTLDIALKTTLKNDASSVIKRGCSEYPMVFPKYGEIQNETNIVMDYPVKWEDIEQRFDNENVFEPIEMELPSNPNFCLGDFYIIQKWIDYAKGLGDPSASNFSNRSIVFEDIYKTAISRKIDFQNYDKF